MADAAIKIEAPGQPIQFIDLQAQRLRIETEINQAVQRVIEGGQYIMGPEIEKLEADLSEFCGAKHTITCSSGTDALMLVLMANNIGIGDAVFVPSFTFAATAEVVALVGATPIFIDSDETSYNMAIESLKAGYDLADRHGVIPRAVIAVDLFGQPADYDAIEPFCREKDLLLIDDAAQGFGGVYKGRNIGTIGQATATSFFPAKPLGCYGDGGAIMTDDADLAEKLISLRFHGKGSHKYDNTRIGMNGRMDTLQAAIVIEKLKIFADEIEKRQTVANRYNEGLKDICVIPYIEEGCTSAWAQYTIRVPNRDMVTAKLKEVGVPTAVYYPLPLHQQTAYKNFPNAGNMSVCEKAAQEVLSLPMHPYMDEETQAYIIRQLQQALQNG